MDLPKRKHNRLKNFDYSQPDAYFITICTQNRRNLFWIDSNAVVDDMQSVCLTEYGRIVERCIFDIPRHYPAISVDQFAIMPNHLHLLIQINTDESGRPMTAPTIANVVNQLKGTVSKYLGFSAWQKGFYDHIVRNNADYLDIWKYIQGNPSKWSEDKLNR